MKTVAIANPCSGRNQTRTAWPLLLQKAGAKAASLETWWTHGPGHGQELAAKARQQRFERVVVVGGDGTLFEVVNGLWKEQTENLPSIGMVPFGTGCDYARNFELGQTVEQKLETALGNGMVQVDAGSCQLTGLDGRLANLVFLNVLGIGFDACVVARFQQRRLQKFGKLAYLACVVRELIGLRVFRFQGKIDERAFCEAGILLVLGIGRCFGGGMQVTPKASPRAGQFHMVWGRRIGHLGVLGLLGKIYAGQHLQHPKVESRHVRQVGLQTDKPALIEIEGEVVGQTPVDVRLIPGAFQFAAKGLRE